MKRLDVCTIHTVLIIVLAIGNLATGEPARQDTTTRYYSISPTAFIPINNDGSYTMSHHEIYGVFSTKFCAPVFLPDSAEVTEFKVWLTDDDHVNDMSVNLVRVQHEGGLQFMSRMHSTGDTGRQVLTDTEIEYKLIDNCNYKYAVDVTMTNVEPHHQGLYGIRLAYRIIQRGTQVE